ncbi:MAG TPA: hypothetical protein VFT31_07095 [Kribbella sp.]|nr:hypothetical protein [Kribbella sp.]
MLIPHDGCLLAHFYAPPSRHAIYTITTAAELGRDGDGWVIAVADMDPVYPCLAKAIRVAAPGCAVKC